MRNKPLTIVSLLFSFAFCLLMAPLADAATEPSLRLPAVISDHAVLQADVPVTIWGLAKPGDTVQVSFEFPNGGGGQGFQDVAAADGRWAGQIAPLKPGTTGKISIHTASGQSLVIDDVIVGQVWLAGGQSNMSYLVETNSKNTNERTTPQLLAAAKDEATAAAGTLRYFATKTRTSDTPLDDVEGNWIIATPETVGKCFALSWNFGVTLHEKIRQPIGLIDSAVGGTVVEAWTPKPELDACSAGPDLEKRYQQRFTKGYPANNPNIPARLYNAMIHGLEPYTLKGAIWFQGDGNCPHPQDYGVLIQTMIKAWRAHFHNEHLAFYYVEMQNYRPPQSQPVEENALSDIREQQQAALALPDTDVATAIDQGIHIPNYEAHFPDKKPLGQRLAGLALDHLYEQHGLVHSPQFKSMKIEGKTIRLQFDFADGLRLRGDELKGFAIRSANGKWVWAKGKIDQDQIVLWNDDVPDPAEVRYGWGWHPMLSVENAAGLPLRPFRTDSPAYLPSGASPSSVQTSK